MIYQFNKKIEPNTKMIMSRLREWEVATDFYLDQNQLYNIPHWADLNLVFIKTLFDPELEGNHVWGGLYRIDTFYTQNDGLRDNKEWDRKYWLNEIFKEDACTRKKHCCPFLMFREMPNGKYQVITINTIAIKVEADGKPYLYINDIFTECDYANEYGIIEDVSKFKFLLIPMDTDYTCSNSESEEDVALNAMAFNRLNVASCTNITIMEDNKIFFDRTDWYEKIKIINPYLTFFKCTISEYDTAISINELIPYGGKIFKDSLIMITPDGEIDLDANSYLTELENNIFKFDEGRFSGYSCIAFYYHEADKSPNMIYRLPEDIVKHDTEKFVREQEDYIMLNRNYFEELMDGRYDLESRSLREQYSLFNDFIDAWYLKVMQYNKNALSDKEIIHPNYMVTKFEQTIRMYFDSDVKFFTTTYRVGELVGKEIEDSTDVLVKKRVWTLYDTHNDYNGISEIMVFLNGMFLMPYMYEVDQPNYNYVRFKKDFLIGMGGGEDGLLEIVHIYYNCNKNLDVVIDKRSEVAHPYFADRYYSPYTSNFFKLYNTPARDKADTTPVFKPNTENNPTYLQPIPFEANTIGTEGDFAPPFREEFSVKFDENWGVILDLLEPLERGSAGVLIKYPGEYIIYAVYNNKLKVIDAAGLIQVFREDIKSEYNLSEYITSHDIFSDMELENPICVVSFEKYIDPYTMHGIAIIYGDEKDNKIYVSTASANDVNGDTQENSQLDISDYIGTVVGYSDNAARGGFALMNDNNNIFEYGFNDNTRLVELKRVINIYLYDFNPIIFKDITCIGFEDYSRSEYDEETRTLYVMTSYFNRTTKIREYYVDEEGNTELTEEFDTGVKFIEPEMTICNDAIYIAGGNSGTTEGDRLFYRVKLLDHTVEQLQLETYVGNRNHSMCSYGDKVIFCGGTYDNRVVIDHATIRHRADFFDEDDPGEMITLDLYGDREPTENNISVYDTSTDTWLGYAEGEHNMVNSLCFTTNDGKYVYAIGGFTSEAAALTNDLSNISHHVTRMNLSTMEVENLPEIDADFLNESGAVEDIEDRNYVYLIGGLFPGIAYRFDCNGGRASKLFDIPMDFKYSNAVAYNYSEKESSVMLVGDPQYGFTHARVLKFVHQDPDLFFVDEYGQYNILFNGYIFTYQDNKDIWVPTHEIVGLYEQVKIKKIFQSGKLYVALGEGNIIFTSPDLDTWYDYQFVDSMYTHDYINKNNELINIDTKYCLGEEKDGITVAISADGKIILNPYAMNTSAYYNTLLLVASTRRFAVDEYAVSPEDDYIRLSNKFKYCLDPDHYIVFNRGILLNRDQYKIVMPNIYNPVDGVYLYINYEREEPTSLFQVVYLPFVMENTIPDTELKPLANLVEFKSEEETAPYGLNMNWNWLFMNGRKVPSNYIETVSNTLLRLKHGKEISKKLFNEENDIAYGEKINLVKVYDRLPDDELVQFMDQFDALIDSMIRDSVITDNSLYSDTVGKKIIEHIDAIPFEDKIVLLKVFSDHYVGNIDRKGYTAPFEGNYDGTNIYINNGNIEWRD